MVQCIMVKSCQIIQKYTRPKTIHSPQLWFVFCIHCFFSANSPWFYLKKNTWLLGHSVSCLAGEDAHPMSLDLQLTTWGRKPPVAAGKNAVEFFIKRILKNHKGRTPFWDPKVAMSFMKVLGPAIYGSNNPLTHEGCGLTPCQMRFTHRKGEVLSSAASKFRFVNEDLGPQ